MRHVACATKGQRWSGSACAWVSRTRQDGTARATRRDSRHACIVFGDRSAVSLLRCYLAVVLALGVPSSRSRCQGLLRHPPPHARTCTRVRASRRATHRTDSDRNKHTNGATPAPTSRRLACVLRDAGSPKRPVGTGRHNRSRTRLYTSAREGGLVYTPPALPLPLPTRCCLTCQRRARGSPARAAAMGWVWRAVRRRASHGRLSGRRA